ncbi:uncharacterized protein LOC132294221 [Cornus florida]|uniref:uncharacterized protein LOC132294221 n=1 Tax=Cornus florida TaxID=4283 RepID=UPI0028A2C577|nr:uncharacterized protein LOC132294221 [Cornus florida]
MCCTACNRLMYTKGQHNVVILQFKEFQGSYSPLCKFLFTFLKTDWSPSLCPCSVVYLKSFLHRTTKKYLNTFTLRRPRKKIRLESEMGFLGFALECFDVLAWPLISLGYPLCASIRAIEVKSNSDMQKLITYWILFSLISLFELGFSKLIEWLPFWPYIKLMAFSYLVLPRFNGAYHVFVCLVRPYIHVNPRVVINKFNMMKELSHKGENYMAMVEKYVEENGSEALEELIASKSRGTKPSHDVEEIKAVVNTEKKEEVTAIQSKCKDPILVQNDTKAVEQTERNAAATVKVKHGVSNLAHAAEKITVAAAKIEEVTATSVAAGGENKHPEITTSKGVQKDLTCAVCQKTGLTEKTLNSHLQGKKHRAKCEKLKGSKQTDKNKGGSSFSTGIESDQSNQEQEPRKLSRKERRRNQNNAAGNVSDQSNQKQEPRKLGRRERRRNLNNAAGTAMQQQ